VLSALVQSCEALNVSAALCLPLAAVISACLEHKAGRQWADQTGVWSMLISAVLSSGGGRYKPSLHRLLIGRLARLWAGPAAEVKGPLEALTRFLVIPSRRLMQPVERDCPPAWLSCCEVLLRLVQHLLRQPDCRALTQTDHHRRLILTLKQQVAPPMEVSPSSFIPAQLFVGLHLLDQSASEESVKTAVQRACKALSRQAERKDALRNVTSLVLDACLLGGIRCCHLSAIAAAPVWSVLHRWRAVKLTSTETDIDGENRKAVEEFVAGDSHLAEVLGTSSTSIAPLEGGDADPDLTSDLDLLRKVFVGRADRPAVSPLEPAALCRLIQPWVLLLKHGVVRSARTQADVLSLMANLCGPTGVTPRHCGDGDVTSLTGLGDVIVNVLESPDLTERVAVCALQCLTRCCRLLPPSRGSGPLWDRLAGLLSTLLTKPTGEDSMDAAGEAVLALVRTANQRAAYSPPTNHSEGDRQATNGGTAPPQPANGEEECSLSGWLATNRLASVTVTSLIGAGPGGRRVAHWLIEEATGAVWRDIEENVDLSRLLASCSDGDVVLDTAPLLYLLRRLSPGPGGTRRPLPPALWRDCLPLLQTALCSGESVVAAAAQRVYRAAVDCDLASGSPVSASAVVSWLRDGAGRSLLSLASRTLPGSDQHSADSNLSSGETGITNDERTSARVLLRRVARLLSGEKLPAGSEAPAPAGIAAEEAEVDEGRSIDQDVGCAEAVVGSHAEDAAAKGSGRTSAGNIGKDMARTHGDVMNNTDDVTMTVGDVTICDRLEPGALEEVRRLCMEVAKGDTGNEGRPRDSEAGLDTVSRDAVISSVLAQSTEEFFSGRVGGGGDGKAQLRCRPEVGISLTEFLTAASAVEATGSGDSATVASSVSATAAPPVPAAERIEALVDRVSARVQEVFRCATMDRKIDIPTDCY
ncbi:uncharacterized protein LOC122365153, partial [Amphibalanus amphitrite]|uniref:uncharacterized protein LOC122365153 n=1 Tax=Amphibalanus amphitrite TaxID=1232801 RepID=UPI001C926F07